MLELSGTWRAAVADEGLGRAFAEPDFDDGGWEDIEVPGHWRSTPAFAECDGSVLYRRQFESPPADDRRWWLVLDGVFYSTDIWLDGAYVGDGEGYFFPQGFEVTDLLSEGREHTLAIEVSCRKQDDRTHKRNLTGVFQHWDCIDPEWNPGGIWRPVRVEDSGPVRIRFFRVLCRDASTESATVLLRAVVDTLESGPVDLVTVVAGHEFVEQRSLAAGENRVEWTVTVPHPELWWPWSMGAQPLFDVHVEVRLAADRPNGGGLAVVSDTRTRRIGFRSVRLRNWIFEINGERMFLKGSNHAPTRMALAEASSTEVARDVELARAANLDILRVHAHIARPELYDAADELGMLVWQDMPLQWGYARGVRKQARRQAREAVDLLAHHPSLAIWCGHNEPMALDIDPEAVFDPQKTASIAARGAAAMFLPTWNKTVLDHSIRRVLEKNDPSRPVIPHSGVLPHPPQLDGTDSHLYFGWYWSDEREFPRAMRLWPRLARFVSEFGAQAVPESDEFLEPDRWPDLDWDHLSHRHSLQKSRFDVYVPPADYATFDEWREATQAYQAEVIRHHIEELRRLKYRPTGGFLQFCFADAYPSVTWSVLDHARVPKQGYDALRRACAPVIVVADRLPASIAPGQRLGLDVHVVSDLRGPIDGAVLDARVRWPGGGHEWRWEGDIAADSCVHVGRIDCEVPSLTGALGLDLTLEAGEVSATNHYEAVIGDD